MVVSGDLHMSLMNELARHRYDPATGRGALATEVVTPSVTRGNLDEAVTNPRLRAAIEASYREANPHVLEANLTDHGYVVLNFLLDQVRVRFEYVPIHEPSAQVQMGPSLVRQRGVGGWKR